MLSNLRSLLFCILLLYFTPSAWAQKTSAVYKAHLNVARQHGVPVIRSSSQVNAYVKKKKLSRVVPNKGYRIQKLTYSSPYLVPRAKSVLNEMARAFYKETKSNFTITSLTRTVHAQQKLRRVNQNAKNGISSHNYGSSFDISYVRFNGRKGTNKRLEKALHKVLANFQARGKILYLKEYHVKCFHVTVR